MKANYPGLRVFYECGDFNILFFHDGLNLLPSVFEEDLFRKSHFYFSFSWRVSEGELQKLASKIAAAEAHEDPGVVKSRLRFLFNSSEEYAAAKSVIDPDMCLFVNNACFLNEEIIKDYPQEKIYAAIYNARANRFKRHDLSRLVENKAFIAYDWKVADLDLSDFAPVDIYRNLEAGDVPRIISKSIVGLMLSAEEGACYASLEYLLCGLPVVSTPSSGGRSEYYTGSNSVICSETPESVASSVAEAVERWKRGDFDPVRIREEAIGKMAVFRRTLSLDLETVFRTHGRQPPANFLDERLAKTNKLWKYRNMRIKSLEMVRG